ncbi:two-component system response regulator DcuR [Serratia odorifera]|jgi:two-component system, CitB family, response regulator DcuR|uniref:Transcriptional regulatory protein n=2 Tax=Serratia odorifera TaxID=618 RepID=D4E5B0_SEROD|nr:two-component system response regulator DcuR [Serratia odorifera]EFE94926.1 response regulator receiver domain protein [Serratia odorifera DSM 4582]MBJ2064352.1 two-component system response regulator DcuR [Serratia odorifera]PNK89769.1 two-component system response regulator DcuR [Serratia odorifera]RII70647.1 two-component system response regulator DcuR [Serratia odorifera]VDZ62162.1 Transcriptional regulatory protein dcuR [Serratia odorifera]
MINVLIVDDDPMVAELNKYYLSQVSGFHCQATVATLAQARALLTDASTSIDLVLLDIYMQQENGLDLLPALRELGEKTDVIIISSASDVDTVQKALHYGVVDYLIKPFQFTRFKQALSNYQQQSQILAQREFCAQADVDNLLRRQPGSVESKKLPKGLTNITLSTVCEWIDQQHDGEFSTDNLANAIGISRVSCRKYLIYLAESGILATRILYGTTGRPVYLYQLKADARALLQAYCR